MVVGSVLAIVVARRLLLAQPLPLNSGQAETSSCDGRFRFGTVGGRSVILESHPWWLFVSIILKAQCGREP